MSNLEELDIKALTKEAEDGNGCAIKNALSGLFWEERLAALTKIVEQNKENKEDNPNTVELRSHSYNGRSRLPRAFMDLHRGPGLISNGPTIYEEEINLATGTFTATCEKPPRRRK